MEDIEKPVSVQDPNGAESAVPIDSASTAVPTGAAVYDVPPPKKGGGAPARRRSWARITLLGLLGLLVIAAASAFGGYQSGIRLRTDAEKTQVAGAIEEQILLSGQDMAEGRYDRARQRLEYVIRIDPDHPGVAEAMAEVLFRMSTTATPTFAPPPTITPTPDTRDLTAEQKLEEQFGQGQQYIANSDWTNAIETLLLLRKSDPNYRAVDIDGMLFIAYRNRGQEKIGHTDLEGGIYDLTVAERFGPLDTEAKGFLTWTSMYITGSSFWEIDWKQAIDYLSQVAAAYPSLTDGSGMSARERYRQALIGYGDTLMGLEDPCFAAEQYQLSLDIGPDPEGYTEKALDEALQACNGVSDEEDDEGDGEESEAPVEPTIDPLQQPLPTTEIIIPPAEEPTPYP